jgi:hypothetical protein
MENWLSKNVPEKARAIFTTICIMSDWEADTSNAGILLMELYTEADIESVDFSYEDFVNFMLSLLY